MSNRDFTKLYMEMKDSAAPSAYYKHVLQDHGMSICEGCGATGAEDNKVYLCETYDDPQLTQRDWQTGGDLSYCSNCLEEMFQGANAPFGAGPAAPSLWADDVEVTWRGVDDKPITSKGSGCTICSPGDAGTHSTEEHSEDFMALVDPCEECGAASGEQCKATCSQYHV